MSTKVEQASTATTAAASSPKISMFAAKSGFVIPKNKLSGSLVPIFRGNKKLGGSDAASEESAKQVQRKTKWGPDLTQDPAVRKGRALAYQTRVDQITQQLKVGSLEIGDNQDSPSASHISDRKSSGVQINSEKSGLLELERREAIGEILKLNPSYKAPADYKPLLKETKVPIPIKEYPGYNFIGLIFGSASDTQKRLEKETGAKIRVYGAKEDTGEKVEITPSDGNETWSVYKELYVHVCADTYEKVDAAVALIELLVTPVSVNPVSASTTPTVSSGDSVNVVHPSQGTPTPYMPPSALNQGLAQPILGSPLAPPHGQFQPYPTPWFPMGPPSGYTTNQNPSPPILNNPAQVSSSPSNAPNMPSLFGPRPVMAGPQNPSFVPSRPQPILQGQRPYMPQPPPLGFMGPPRTPMPAQPNTLAPPPFTGNQPFTTGAPPHNMRPLAATLPQSAPPLTFLNRPLTSAGWSQAPDGPPMSLGPSNAGQMARPMVPPSQGPHPVSGGPPLNMVSPMNSPFRPPVPQSSGAPANHPIAAPAYASVPQPQMGISPVPSSSFPISTPHMPTRPHSSMSPMQPIVARPNNVFGSTQILSPLASAAPPPPTQSGNPRYVSGTAPSFTPVKPPSVSTPVPLHPSSNNFTFQPHRPQNPVSPVMPRPSPQNLPVQQPQAPQTSFRPAMHNSAPPPAMQGFPRPHVSNQTSQPRAQISTNLPHGPPRHPAFPNSGPVQPTTPVPQMGPRNFGPAPFPPRPSNPVPLQQNYPAMGTGPRGFLAPNQQQFSGNQPFPSVRSASSPSGPQQIYDPFSPTSVPVPQVGGNPAKVGKQESDPEYEDLMASVGVK